MLAPVLLDSRAWGCCDACAASQSALPAAHKQSHWPVACCVVPQIDAKLAEEMLRQQLADQQAEADAAWRAQLHGQQQQLEAVRAGLSTRVGELQAALKATDAQIDSKVRLLPQVVSHHMA